MDSMGELSESDITRIETLARLRHAEMERGFPKFTRQSWEEMFDHTRAAFLWRAYHELKDKGEIGKTAWQNA